MTKTSERKRQDERIKAHHAEIMRIVDSGACPLCGSSLRRNMSMSVWYQCAQYVRWQDSIRSVRHAVGKDSPTERGHDL